MSTKDFDQGVRSFWGEEFFPYGLSRSGEFTCQQVALLQAHGHAYERLANGSRAARTDLEREFVAFCNGERDAQSPHEKAWARYRDKVSERSGHYWLGGHVKAATFIPETPDYGDDLDY